MLAGCSGDDGSAGTPGAPGAPGPGTTSAAETITFTLDKITIASPPVVDFTLTNEDGVRFTGLAQGQIRFTLSKLLPEMNGAPSSWQSYLNKTETPTVGPGTAPAIQATNESNGTLVNNLDGTYRYTFVTDVTNVTSPLAVSYDPTLTHRLGVQISGGDLPVANAVYDWRPSDGATTGLAERIIVQTSSCNECHGKLALHGGGRIETKLCVTCHNPGSTDANSTNTVDFKVMIHKIHRGESLPSVVAGGEYAIWGFGDTKEDFSDVVFPQDIRNCTKCHDAGDAATPQAGNWQSVPSVAACGSCHDDVNFATGQGHSPSNFVAQDGQCTICHSAGGFVGTVAASHSIPSKVEGAKYAFTIVSASSTGPGQFPVVTYRVTDPTNADAPYDVMSTTFKPWASGSLSIVLGWNTDDYHNVGNGSLTTPASAVTLNARAASSGNNTAPINDGSNTFTVTSLRAIPASITGSGTAGMYGRAAADFDGDGNFTDRVPIKAVVKPFAITDATPVARRSVVAIAKCDLCHDQLSLHGSGRTDEPQLCVMCHNPNNTDIRPRPLDPTTTIDGLKEQTIDFKYMIHAIHGADMREKPYVVGSDNFSTVRFPGILNNCATCHQGSTYAVPLGNTVTATTIDTGGSDCKDAEPASGTDCTDASNDTKITPTAAVCSSCHDTSLARTHMEQNGASFVMIGDPGTYNESCAVCHGAGRLADVSEVHHVTP